MTDRSPVVCTTIPQEAHLARSVVVGACWSPSWLRFMIAFLPVVVYIAPFSPRKASQRDEISR